MRALMYINSHQAMQIYTDRQIDRYRQRYILTQEGEVVDAHEVLVTSRRCHGVAQEALRERERESARESLLVLGGGERECLLVLGSSHRGGEEGGGGGGGEGFTQIKRSGGATTHHHNSQWSLGEEVGGGEGGGKGEEGQTGGGGGAWGRGGRAIKKIGAGSGESRARQLVALSSSSSSHVETALINAKTVLNAAVGHLFLQPISSPCPPKIFHENGLQEHGERDELQQSPDAFIAYDDRLLSVVNTRRKLREVASDAGEEDTPSLRHVSTVSCLPSSSMPLPPSPHYTTSAPPCAIADADCTEGARARMTGSCVSARPTHQVASMHQVASIIYHSSSLVQSVILLQNPTHQLTFTLAGTNTCMRGKHTQMQTADMQIDTAKHSHKLLV